MAVTVIIPTLNGEKYIRTLTDCLLTQTVQAEILYVDSGSSDRTVETIREYEQQKYGNQVKLLQVSPDCFDHGGTRDYALRQSNGEFVLFLTQDALPTDNRYIEKLLEPFKDERIAGVCGRQIARDDAPAYEKLTREFNYPPERRVWSENDIDKYGVKSYFFSDACSAYRRSAYNAVGGFDSPIITNEDMMIAGKFLHAGYSMCYNAEAAVYHSHRFTLRQEYERNVKIGYVMEQYRERLIGAKSDKEGLRMAIYVAGKLLKQGRVLSLCGFAFMLFAKFFGNRKGKQMFKNEDKNLFNEKKDH